MNRRAAVAIAASAVTVVGGALTGGRAVIRTVDAPARVDSVELELQRTDSVHASDRRRTRRTICEMHGLFPSECPLYEDEGEGGG